MGVPKAAVYKDNCIISWEDKVRFPRIALITNSIAESSFPESRANLFFRLSIFRTDMRHVFMAVFRG